MTLTLDEDVFDRARMVAARLRRPLRAVINEALRVGLWEVAQRVEQRAYRTQPHPMGRRIGCCLNNIQEVLVQTEGDDAG